MTLESVGARLKKIRLERGLSLEEAHKQTKIHLKILKAIEEDDLINLSPIYVKGFLKIYCKFLEVDPRQFIPDYKETRVVVQLKSENPDKGPSFLKNASLKLGNWRPRIKINPKVVVIIVALFVSIFVLYSLGKFISSKVAEHSRKAKIQLALSAQTAVTAQKKSQTTAQAARQKSTSVVTEIRLGIRARENCYINLKADGRAIFQGVLKKGRFESWQAKDKFDLSLGNAGVVDLEINGKLISNLGKRGKALKNISITKEGLSIGK